MPSFKLEKLNVLRMVVGTVGLCLAIWVVFQTSRPRGQECLPSLRVKLEGLSMHPSFVLEAPPDIVEPPPLISIDRWGGCYLQGLPLPDKDLDERIYQVAMLQEGHHRRFVVKPHGELGFKSFTDLLVRLDRISSRVQKDSLQRRGSAGSPIAPILFFSPIPPPPAVPIICSTP